MPGIPGICIGGILGIKTGADGIPTGIGILGGGMKGIPVGAGNFDDN